MGIGKQSTNQILIYLALVAVTAVGVVLRWRFIHTVHLYPDEFATLLAIKMIGQSGWPVMPSGLFFEHGLLFSYAGSLTALWGSGHLAVRYVSLLCGALTLLLTFWIGRRWFSPAAGLIATAGLVMAPMAIHWSGRARMYALLQLLVLITLWLVYEGVVQNKPHLRWLALLTYLGATLTHFVAVILAPSLVLATVFLWWSGVEAKEQEDGEGSSLVSPHLRPAASLLWLEAIALGGVFIIAFWVKRMGQPKGIEALDGNVGQALTGLVEVFKIYSDFSLNLLNGWQAIAPFYLTLPALIFTPFALLAFIISFISLFNPKSKIQNPKSTVVFFLSITLLITTLAMILFASPDRRDDKYQFMLLPVLLLLGAQGIIVISNQLLVISYQWFASNSKLSVTNNLKQSGLLITNIVSILISGLIIITTWPNVQSLLNNTGDDYASAFAYVQEHWQTGDTILTGTPTAAALYLGRNDFYSVQRGGGYDYRILTVNDQPVDRWLGSPVIRTEAALHQTLANNNVWLVLERWGLQQEYYDLPFQQQLLAQTSYVTESQGIFVLRSKANPQPIALEPIQTAQATFSNLVQLVGYTVEPKQIKPDRSLRLTLYWQALASIPYDYTVFVHLRDQNGGNVAQADHRPLANFYPTTLWPIGETIRETSELSLSPDLPAGNYNLWIGLYLLETGERLPIQNDTGNENAIRLGTLILEE